MVHILRGGIASKGGGRGGGRGKGKDGETSVSESDRDPRLGIAGMAGMAGSSMRKCFGFDVDALAKECGQGKVEEVR